MRARILDAKTGMWYPAWANHVAQDQARLRLKSSAKLTVGNRVLVECYGDGTVVRFAGVLSAQRDLEVAVQVCGSLSFVPSEESVRIVVHGVGGSLSGPMGRWNFVVADASPDGVGVFVNDVVPVDTDIDLGVDLPIGHVEGRAQAVYCCESQDPRGRYRVGMRIVEMKRLESALWIKFLHDSTES